MFIAITIEARAALSVLVTGALLLASTLALRSLRNAPAADGIRTMSAISLAIAKPLKWLMSGAALPCMAAALIWFIDWSWGRLDERAAIMASAGGVIYGLGVILVTAERSIPLDRLLGTATHASSDMIWRIYWRDWGLWNHVRLAACTAASALLIAAVALHTVYAIDRQLKRNLGYPSPMIPRDDFRWPDDCPYCSQPPAPQPS